MANSYLPVTTVEIIPMRLIYRAKTPKSSGEKILVRTGVDSTRKPCAITVPVESLATFLVKSLFNTGSFRCPPCVYPAAAGLLCARPDVISLDYFLSALPDFI